MIATFDFINHASGVVLAAILNTALVAFAAAAIVWIALRFTPRVNAATRHAAWWAVLALVAIVPALPQSFTPALRSVAPSVEHSAISSANSISQTGARGVQGHTPAIHETASTNSSKSASLSLSPASRLASSEVPHATSAKQTHSFLPFEFRAGNWLGNYFRRLALSICVVDGASCFELRASSRGEESRLRRHGRSRAEIRTLFATGAYVNTAVVAGIARNIFPSRRGISSSRGDSAGTITARNVRV